MYGIRFVDFISNIIVRKAFVFFKQSMFIVLSYRIRSFQ